MIRRMLAAFALCAALPAGAQDAAAWLESQGLEAADTREADGLDVVVARVKGAKDLKEAEERVVVLRKGKPLWQTTNRDGDPGSKWTIHAIGDLDGDNRPDLHVSSFSGGAHCCTTHHVLRLKPGVRRLAVYSAGNVGGGEFMTLPDRKTPVMISADDSSAFAFAPYANSYFPVMILEVGANGKLRFARDLMQSRLPGQPPPICAIPAATKNLWLKERCGEYATSRRHERTKQVKSRLAAIKAERSADRLKWEDYFENGVLAAVSAEMNRYTYTGHGHAAMKWLETVWPGNDAIKVRFVQTLRQTQAKSVFASDLRGLAASYQ